MAESRARHDEKVAAVDSCAFFKPDCAVLQIDQEYDDLLDRVKTNQTHIWAKEYADQALDEDSDAVSTRCCAESRSNPAAL